MKKLIFIVLGLLILGSCSLTSKTEKTSNTAPTTANEQIAQASKTTYAEDIENTSDKIKNTDEFKGCMKQQATMCIQSTGMQIAQKMKDTAFCKELSSPEQQESCEFAITMVNAQEKNDDKLCDTLKNAQYIKQCKIQIYRQEAIDKKDITICGKIDALRNWTGAESTVDTNMQKDQCIMQFIMSSPTSDEKDCTKLTDDASFQMCTTMVKNRPQMPTPPTGALPLVPTNLPPPSTPNQN